MNDEIKSERVFSGIQPSGEIHIGNYLGAVKTWVQMTQQHDAIFCVVDDHAITVEYDAKLLPERTFEAVLTTMACGLDPAHCTLFVQSHVPEHTELCWLFNTLIPLGSLFRMTQFKDKSRNALNRAIDKKGGGATASLLHQLRGAGAKGLELADGYRADLSALDPEAAHPDAALVARLNDAMGSLMQHLQVGTGISEASAALLDYPVLQAADILLYKATLVPVGEDQEQHLELCREVAERFNRRYGPTFPIARRVPGEARRILGLDGKQKMSKSLNNQIGVLDTEKQVKKKIGGAFTDPQRVRREDPGRPEVCNIFSLHHCFTAKEQCEELAHGCRTAGIGCGDCKQVLIDNLNRALDPIRARAESLKASPAVVLDALDEGAQRCRTIAKETMDEVRAAMGIGRQALARYAR